ncbi:MAG: YkgJ family cysteine cluster protein [Acidobacteria bacterium]|nr:YkgJ family cysteine cluster protein [Acidobacteriota bacterium]MCZ6726745.1 YkgJ family cysteine cluster protein [Acidobacteriota bacterium]
MAGTSSEPWYREGLRFACTRCGACCRGPGYVWTDPGEVEVLAARLSLEVDEFGRRYLRRVGRRLSLVDGPDGACVFWDNGCSVYPARPRQCRTFPFWAENLTGEAAWNETAKLSPGVNQGRLYELQEIEDLRGGSGSTSGVPAAGALSTGELPNRPAARDTRVLQPAPRGRDRKDSE